MSTPFSTFFHFFCSLFSFLFLLHYAYNVAFLYPIFLLPIIWVRMGGKYINPKERGSPREYLTFLSLTY
nr:MAG TPA: hypothetical protein [Caudoviricetes sp.]